jgi:Ser/Thr protein kinase RdoA (MazF antagonist)
MSDTATPFSGLSPDLVLDAAESLGLIADGRLLHYSAWIARRWNDPAFPAAFTWFRTRGYWQERILELREQIAAMEEGPFWVL